MIKIKSKIQKKLKKIILYSLYLIIITLISYIIKNYKVNAGQNDSELVKNYIGYYVYVNFDGQDHGYNAIRYTMNNRTVYCIELGTDITSYTYNSTDNLKSSGLTDEQIQYIKLLSYYGYDYKNHNSNIKYYLATQELIWTYLKKDATMNWVESKTNPNNIINIDKEKEEIISLVNKHTIKPNLPQNIEISLGSKIELEDSNNILSNYKIEDNKCVKTTIIDNKLIIEPIGTIIGNCTLNIKQIEEYNDNTKLYYYDKSQKMISAGTIETNTISININIKGVKIKFLKYDSDRNINIPSGQASLEDAIYELYDNNQNLLLEFKTDKYGSYTFNELPYGTYYVKEKTPSKGYLLDDNMIKVNIYNQINIIVYEQVIKSQIEILKTYGNNNHQKPESNIKFNIYDNKNKLYKTIITDNNGYINFELPYGIYTIVQDNSTKGYKKVDDIKITIDENSEKIIRYNLLDNNLTTHLKIIKVDSISELPIINNHASFKIKDKSTNNYLKYNDTETFETNDNGEVIIPLDIPYGTYIIEEIKVPNNYKKEKDIEITIDENSNFYYDEKYGYIVDIKLLNTLSKSNLKIIKDKEIFTTNNNNYTYEFIKDSNSKLDIYAKDNIISPDGIIRYNKGDIIKTITTNEEGLSTINNLFYGDYCIKEKNKDKNYIDNEDKCFTLKDDNQTIYIHNYLKKGNIKVFKTDIDTGLYLKGAIIELYTNNDKLINTSMTNKEGIITINNIPLGTYYLKEKKAPDNYNLDDTKYFLTIEENNKDIPIYLTNKKIENINPSHTGIIKNKNNILIIITIMFIIGMLRISIVKIIKK